MKSLKRMACGVTILLAIFHFGVGNEDLSKIRVFFFFKSNLRFY